MELNEGIRLLIGEAVASETIIAALEISAEKLGEVNELIKKERAEYWLSTGAKPSVVVKSLFKKAGVK